MKIFEFEPEQPPSRRPTSFTGRDGERPPGDVQDWLADWGAEQSAAATTGIDRECLVYRLPVDRPFEGARVIAVVCEGPSRSLVLLRRDFDSRLLLDIFMDDRPLSAFGLGVTLVREG